MSIVKTDFTLTTNHALALVGVAVVGVVAYKIKKSVEININKINPASRENVIYQVSGGATVPSIIKSNDLFFAEVTLLSPWASDEAKQDAQMLKDVFYGEYGGGE